MILHRRTNTLFRSYQISHKDVLHTIIWFALIKWRLIGFQKRHDQEIILVNTNINFYIYPSELLQIRIMLAVLGISNEENAEQRLLMLEHASFTAPFQQYFHYAQLSRKLSNWPVPSKILQKQLKRISDFQSLLIHHTFYVGICLLIILDSYHTCRHKFVFI